MAFEFVPGLLLLTSRGGRPGGEGRHWHRPPLSRRSRPGGRGHRRHGGEIRLESALVQLLPGSGLGSGGGLRPGGPGQRPGRDGLLDVLPPVLVGLLGPRSRLGLGLGRRWSPGRHGQGRSAPAQAPVDVAPGSVLDPDPARVQVGPLDLAVVVVHRVALVVGEVVEDGLRDDDAIGKVALGGSSIGLKN